MNGVGSWVPFNDANNQKVEAAYVKKKGKGTSKFKLNHSSVEFKVHFNGSINMYQINAVTRVRQTVRRIKSKTSRMAPVSQRMASPAPGMAGEKKKRKKKKVPQPTGAARPAGNLTSNRLLRRADNGGGGMLAGSDGDSMTSHSDTAYYTARSEGDTLIRSAGLGKSDEVEKMLAQGIDVNYADSYGRTPLINAALKGHTAIVTTILLANADVHKADKSGATALMKAITHRKAEVAAQLHAAGAFLTEKDRLSVIGEQLGSAASLGKSQEVHQLVAKGVDVNCVDKTYGWPPLTQATASGHIQVVRSLLLAQADVNNVDKDGRTALYYAMTIGHGEIEARLRDANAVLSVKDKSTLLFSAQKDKAKQLVRAAEYGKFEEVVSLIGQRAEVNYAEEKYGDTSLIRACYNGHAGIVSALISADSTKAHIGKANKNGVTALMTAVEYKHADIVKLLNGNTAARPEQDRQIPLAHAVASTLNVDVGADLVVDEEVETQRTPQTNSLWSRFTRRSEAASGDEAAASEVEATLAPVCAPKKRLPLSRIKEKTETVLANVGVIGAAGHRAVATYAAGKALKFAERLNSNMGREFRD